MLFVSSCCSRVHVAVEIVVVVVKVVVVEIVDVVVKRVHCSRPGR